MSKLQWNDYEVIECLGLAPGIDDYDTGYHFTKENKGLRLDMSIWPFESLVVLSLFSAGLDRAVLTIWFVVRESLHHVHDKRGNYLRFANIVVVRPSRSYYLTQGDVFDNTKWPPSVDLILMPDPFQIYFENT
ncbi:hypothetical protein BH10ACI2_BH10ACI2_01810 [soil metagenome]